MTAAFLEALGADGPAGDRVGQMGLYGWLIGSWDLDVSHFLADGSTRRRDGEWHFGWVLEGRAIQDVWIVPPRGQRHDDAAGHAQSYGSTLRIYDPRDGSWQIQWTDPVTLNFCNMKGCRDGADIVQFGRNASGEEIRWRFMQITADSFLWRGETSTASGWRRDVEFAATRRT